MPASGRMGRDGAAVLGEVFAAIMGCAHVVGEDVCVTRYLSLLNSMLCTCETMPVSGFISGVIL
jgi:hypothetical protein